MNRDYDRMLEAQIDAELKALPHVKAPTELQAKVFASIAARPAPATASWLAWPPALRVATFLGLAALFAAICFAGWHVRELEIVGSAGRHLTEIWSSFGLAAELFQTLGSAVMLLLRNLNWIILTSIVVTALFAYSMWVAMGALWFRIAFASTNQS